MFEQLKLMKPFVALAAVAMVSACSSGGADADGPFIAFSQSGESLEIQEVDGVYEVQVQKGQPLTLHVSDAVFDRGAGNELHLTAGLEGMMRANLAMCAAAGDSSFFWPREFPQPILSPGPLTALHMPQPGRSGRYTYNSIGKFSDGGTDEGGSFTLTSIPNISANHTDMLLVGADVFLIAYDRLQVSGPGPGCDESWGDEVVQSADMQFYRLRIQ